MDSKPNEMQDTTTTNEEDVYLDKVSATLEDLMSEVGTGTGTTTTSTKYLDTIQEEKDIDEDDGDDDDEEDVKEDTPLYDAKVIYQKVRSILTKQVLCHNIQLSYS